MSQRPTRTAPMLHLFSPVGEAALLEVLPERPLLAFDFDGTLAPIVHAPEAARVSRAVSARLARLGRILPVAIITGRAVDDVRGRLGFEPAYVVGNHGAEMAGEPAAAVPASPALDEVRAMLAAQRTELAAAGVRIEDKGLSLALHYRLSRQPGAALTLIRRILDRCGPGVRVFSGKMVENIVPDDAPDKSHAMLSLMARSGASCAVFAGDDVNDEPVFAIAPPTWLTIKIGRDDPASRARFFLDSPAEVAMLLDRMLRLLQAFDRDRDAAR